MNTPFGRLRAWTPVDKLNAAEVSYEFDNTITAVNDVASAVSENTPSGVINMFAGQAAPSGWLICDGTAVSRTTYSNLFAAIGTTFGAGNGSSTFTLPDFRGIFPKGAGTTNRALGQDANGNYYAGALGTYTQDKMQGHKHSLTNNNGEIYQYVSPSGVKSNIAAGTVINAYAMEVGSPTTDGTNGTPRTGMTTEPQSLGITFIIKC